MIIVIVFFFFKKIVKDIVKVEFKECVFVFDFIISDFMLKCYIVDVLFFVSIDFEKFLFKILGLKLELMLVKVDGVFWLVLCGDEVLMGEIL